MAALTELIKQRVNAVLGKEAMIVNKMGSSSSVRTIFKHQHCLRKPHKRLLVKTTPEATRLTSPVTGAEAFSHAVMQRKCLPLLFLSDIVDMI